MMASSISLIYDSFSFFCIIKSPWRITVFINLDHLVNVLSSRFIYYKVPFPYSVFWKQDTKSILHSSRGDLSFTSWRRYYLESFVRKIHPFSRHLFIQSFIYQYAHVYIYFILYVIIQYCVFYFLAQVVALRALWSWFLYPFDTPSFLFCLLF